MADPKEKTPEDLAADAAALAASQGGAPPPEPKAPDHFKIGKKKYKLKFPKFRIPDVGEVDLVKLNKDPALAKLVVEKFPSVIAD